MKHYIILYNNKNKYKCLDPNDNVIILSEEDLKKLLHDNNVCVDNGTLITTDDITLSDEDILNSEEVFINNKKLGMLKDTIYINANNWIAQQYKYESIDFSIRKINNDTLAKYNILGIKIKRSLFNDRIFIYEDFNNHKLEILCLCDTIRFTNGYGLFRNTRFTHIDIMNVNLSNLTSTQEMFRNTPNLIDVKMNINQLKNVNTYQNMYLNSGAYDARVIGMLIEQTL